MRAATPRNGKFLYSALEHTPPAWVEEFFESLGVPLKVELGSTMVWPSSSAIHRPSPVEPVAG